VLTNERTDEEVDVQNLESKSSFEQVRLCVVGPSGSGKSTVVSGLRRQFEALGCSVETLKLAQPLYDLQGRFYDTIGRALASGDQDQILMETIARELRRIDPAALVVAFERRLRNCQADVVLNDDLRDDETDAPRLRMLGFLIARVVTAESVRISRLLQRQDATAVRDSPLDRQIARLPVDIVINNSQLGFENLAPHVEALADYVAAHRKRDRMT
jgi:cytidine deaminase